MILQGPVAGGIAHSGGLKSRVPQPAGIAAAAGGAARLGLIARHRLCIVDPEAHTLADDLRLAPLDQRRVDPARAALDSGARCERSQAAKGADELRAAVRVAARIEHVDPDEQVA